MDGLVYDAHTHTSFSDGKSTAQENVRAAEACGLSCVALTDHLYPDTNHDDVHTWVATAEALDAVSRVTVVSGLEASILDTEGALSVGAEEAAAVRFVLADMGEGTRGVAVDPPASIKRYEENLLAAMSNAAQNPVVDAIAHPFNLGRFDAALTPEQLSRSGLRRLAGTMADSNVAFEIMNEAHWWYPRMPVAEFTSGRRSSMPSLASRRLSSMGRRLLGREAVAQPIDAGAASRQRLRLHLRKGLSRGSSSQSATSGC